MSIRIGSDSMMAQNFFNASSGESRYAAARHLAAQADRQAMSSRQNSILAAGMAACAAAENMSQRILEGKKIARQMGFDMQQSAFETSERNLDELRRRLEEKAKQAQKDPAESKGDTQTETHVKTEVAAATSFSLSADLPVDLPASLHDALANDAADNAAEVVSGSGSVISKGAIKSAETASGNLSAAGGDLREVSVNSGAGVANTAMAVAAATGDQPETLGISVVV